MQQRHKRRIVEATARVPAYEQRLGEAYPYEAELVGKEDELDAIEKDLEATSMEDGTEGTAVAA